MTWRFFPAGWQQDLVESTATTRSPAKPTPGVFSTFFWSSRSDPHFDDWPLQVVYSALLQTAGANAGQLGLVFSYLRVLMYSKIALAFSSFNPEMPLLCGGLLPVSPLVMCSTT